MPTIPQNRTLATEKEKLTLAVGKTIELKKVYYDFDEYYIRESSTKALDWVAHLMKTYPSLTIELLAHTDARGTTQ